MKVKRIIGRTDACDLPALNLKDIDIKIDTGAYTSAIHCSNIQKTIIDGVEVIQFYVLDPSHPNYENKQFTVSEFKEKRIKNSFGKSEKRFIIRTSIILFQKKYKIDLSLSERGEMRFPILIGRKFLVGKFIVDPSKTDLSKTEKLENQ